MTPEKIFDILSKMATDVTPVAAARIAATIVYKDKIVSFGVNERKSHPFQAKYQKNKEAIYWHAENRAIFNALRVMDKTDLKNSTLYVCRMKYEIPYKRRLISGMAKPCEGCDMCIEEHKIKKIVYTVDSPDNFRLGYTTLVK